MAIAKYRSEDERFAEVSDMTKVRDYFQHTFNPLHVFCRLRRFGLSRSTARHLCWVYERGLYRFLL
jgi:hypothetical protein